MSAYEFTPKLSDAFPDDFSADCTRCAAMCCMALAFDRGDSFAHDKPAGVGCHHLSKMSCSVHANLTELGYSGCVAFDCLGAGQRITALFADDFNGHWRDTPSLTSPMIDAFRAMRDVQELRHLLNAAATLPLPKSKERERQDWLSQLKSATGNLELLNQVDTRHIRLWLRGLAEVVTPTAEPEA